MRLESPAEEKRDFTSFLMVISVFNKRRAVQKRSPAEGGMSILFWAVGDAPKYNKIDANPATRDNAAIEPQTEFRVYFSFTLTITSVISSSAFKPLAN